MKNNTLSKPFANVCVLTLAALLLCVSQGRGADANPPERMTYQGYLTDSSGSPLGSPNPKNYDVIFRVWSDPSAGTRLWAEQQTITVDKGYFSVMLGEGATSSGEPRPALSTVFTNALNASDRYIEMTVKSIGANGADSTMLPRIRFLSSPYSYLARNAINANGANYLVNGANSAVLSATGTNLTMAGSVTASSVTAGTFIGNGTIPVGGIIMWSGTIANIPTGWALCDGNNGTPNLRDRFIVGAGSAYAVANVGGNPSTTLSLSQIPSHAHTYKDGYILENGSDFGGANALSGFDYVGSGHRGNGSLDNNNDYVFYRTMTSDAAGAATPADVQTLPPYYALAFIMRIQ